MKYHPFIIIKFTVLFIWSFLWLSASPHAQEAPPLPSGDFTGLRITQTAPVTQIIDPLRVRLANEKIVQLVPLDVPGIGPYEQGEHALAAQNFLTDLLKGRQVRLYQNTNKQKGQISRMGYLLGQLERKNRETGEPPIWVQGALLSRGLARIHPTADNIDMADQMLALEEQARRAGLGIWADADGPYAVKTPENAGDALNSWAIVEGRVKKQAAVNNTLYLNFGANWRTDFTIGIKPAIRRQMAHDSIDPATDFAGRRVRVRGWIEDYNGPYIELIHPVWIQILPEPPTQTMLDNTANN